MAGWTINKPNKNLINHVSHETFNSKGRNSWFYAFWSTFETNVLNKMYLKEAKAGQIQLKNMDRKHYLKVDQNGFPVQIITGKEWCTRFDTSSKRIADCNLQSLVFFPRLAQPAQSLGVLFWSTSICDKNVLSVWVYKRKCILIHF